MTAHYDNTVDDLRNTILEGYNQTLDMEGPNFKVMAEDVYADHVAPLEAEIERLRSECKVKTERLESSMERLRQALDGDS